MQDLEAILEALSPGARIAHVQALTGGVSAEVVALAFTRPEGEPEEVVVRRRLPGQGGGLSLALEHALLTRLHAARLPVPRPRLFRAPDVLVMERVDGTTELPPGAALAMADALARLHAQRGDLLSGLPEREDPAPTLRALLPTVELSAALDAWAAAPAAHGLLHGDFWPGNLLWRGGALAAILDWEDAAAGDPLSDLACARVELEVAAGGDAADAFTARYLQTTGLAPARLLIWDLYVTTTALAAMDQWGLPLAVLEHRRSITHTAQQRALSALHAQHAR